MAEPPAAAPAALTVALKLYYTDKNYPAARAALGGPAELGAGRAQYLLGTMLLNGEGGDADPAAGYGWLQAAAENGSEDALVLEDKVRTATADLPLEQRARAADVLARYGSVGIAQRLVPLSADLHGCRGLRDVDLHDIVAPEYPGEARRRSQDAAVYLRFTVGVDGLAREPEVLAAFPDDAAIIARAIEAVMMGRFYPAEIDGRPVETSSRYRTRFKMTSGGVLWDESAIKRVKAQLEIDNPSAEFAIASASWSDPTEFKIPTAKSQDLMLRAAQGGHPRAQYWLAQLLTTSTACGPSPKGDAWLEAAARSGEPTAAVLRARRLLAGTPSPDDQQLAHRLLADAARSESAFAARQAVAILATSPLEAVRDAPLALAAARKLHTEAYEYDPHTWEALAAARAANGNFHDAAALEERALRLADRYRWNTSRLQQRLARYSAGEAWTGDLLAVPPVEGGMPPAARLGSCTGYATGTMCLYRTLVRGAVPLDRSR